MVGCVQIGHGQGLCDGMNPFQGFGFIPLIHESQGNQGICGGWDRSAECHCRPLAVRADGEFALFHSEGRVPADAFGVRSQGPDQAFILSPLDAYRF